MASSRKTSMGLLILQIALAAYLIICGIMAFQMVTQPSTISGLFQKAGAAISNSGSTLRAVYDVFENDDISKIIVIILGVGEIFAGAFILITMVASLGKFETTGYLISIIIWLVIMLFVNVLGGAGLIHIASDNFYTAMSILGSLALNLVILSGIMILRKK